jgi:hypothetical protein
MSGFQRDVLDACQTARSKFDRIFAVASTGLAFFRFLALATLAFAIFSFFADESLDLRRHRPSTQRGKNIRGQTFSATRSQE